MSEDEKIKASEGGESSGDTVIPSAKPVPYKLDWYQTESTVVATVFIKNVQKDETKIKLTREQIDGSLSLPNGETVDLLLELEHPIEAERSTYKILSTKIEFRLAKADAYQWKNLEKVKEKKDTTKKTTKNWDKVVSEMDEEQEGEAVLNALFQKIYAEGSDEVKKAMNKSFIESGGTELNTNWDAVGKGRVSIKPPEGMEWKSWDSP